MALKNDVFILPVRHQVVFPSVRASVALLPQTFTDLSDFLEKHGDTQQIGVLTVKEAWSDVQDIRPEHLNTIGTYCRVVGFSESTTSTGKKKMQVANLSLEGLSRCQVQNFAKVSPFLVASLQLIEADVSGREVQQLGDEAKKALSDLLQDDSRVRDGKSTDGMRRGFEQSFGKTNRRWPSSPAVLADFIAAGLTQITLAEKQQVLETVDVKQRLELVLSLISKVKQVRELSREISSKTNRQSEDELRETVLRRQLAELQKEMRKLKAKRSSDEGEEEADEEAQGHEDEDEEDEMSVLRESIKKAQLSAEAQKIANRELRRLQNLRPNHLEYSGCRTYLETLASLPWAVTSTEDVDLPAAHAILERDHHGLDKVKRRILEFLAVHKMRGGMNGPILCLHGPPGVGKTSLGRSVAKALGRKFHRIALGGVRDEAELRGHRRTYIGSMPGAIMQALIGLGVKNPVILLDEVDKLTRNAMFNPSGALLELLDPEQNNSFKDHYVNTAFDLSNAIFLCTCNELHSIDRPLQDRMEIIELSGYTVEEKIRIASTHLVPKQLKLHALEGSAEPLLRLTQAAISDLVLKWTMESGVRSLERRIAQVCRWAALRLGEKREDGVITVDAQQLPLIIGAEIFEPDLAERLTVGVAMGLGVTTVGGQLLFVEATRGKGTGQLIVTGQLGDVMRESVITAMSLLRSKIYNAALASDGRAQAVVRLSSAPAPRPPALRSQRQSRQAQSSQVRASASLHQNLRRPSEEFQEVFQEFLSLDPSQDPFGGDDIHVHFPAGAIPKDGPSAGVATTLALASLLLGRPLRSDTAMTGEITLRGKVLPVGGIRDKVLAAHRAGVEHVLLPAGNAKHVEEDIPDSVLDKVQLHFVKHIDEAIAWVFATGSSGSGRQGATPVSHRRAKL